VKAVFLKNHVEPNQQWNRPTQANRGHPARDFTVFTDNCPKHVSFVISRRYNRPSCDSVTAGGYKNESEFAQVRSNSGCEDWAGGYNGLPARGG
jgi:hypothetical protein